MRFRILGAACCLWLTVSGPTVAAEAPAADPLAQANEHYALRTNPQELQLAIDGYTALTAQAPDNFAAWWRLARAYWYLGDHSPKDKRVGSFEKCELAAKQAIRVAPDKWDGHYWLAVGYGRKGEEQGILNSLFLVDPIDKELQTVVSLNPDYGMAYYILGSLYRQAPGWPLSRGDIQKSLGYARQAVAKSPDVVITHVGLAETLLALNKKDEARAELQAALDAPGLADEQPEAATDKEKARKLLKDIR
jgi:tetratricopeptide (TPR) repeat protein